MSRPVHFDVAEVLAAHEAIVCKMEASDPPNPGTQIQIRIARLVARAFIEFTVDERNRQTPPELAIVATASAVANMIETMKSNFPHPQSDEIFSEVLHIAADRHQAGPGHRYQTASIQGVEGGSA